MTSVYSIDARMVATDSGDEVERMMRTEPSVLAAVMVYRSEIGGCGVRVQGPVGLRDPRVEYALRKLAKDAVVAMFTSGTFRFVLERSRATPGLLVPVASTDTGGFLFDMGTKQKRKARVYSWEFDCQQSWRLHSLLGAYARVRKARAYRTERLQQALGSVLVLETQPPPPNAGRDAEFLAAVRRSDDERAQRRLIDRVRGGAETVESVPLGGGTSGAVLPERTSARRLGAENADACAGTLEQEFEMAVARVLCVPTRVRGEHQMESAQHYGFSVQAHEDMKIDVMRQVQHLLESVCELIQSPPGVGAQARRQAGSSGGAVDVRQLLLPRTAQVFLTAPQRPNVKDIVTGRV